MDASVRLGRIAGVEVGVNWSWLVVFALIVWSLTAAVFPDANPGLGDGTYLAMAIAAALTFFASILLHELGHAVEARRQGMAIAGITLWMFGGVARFEGRFPSARAELRIAAAGPLVSLLLGVALSLAAIAIPFPTAVDGVVAWLGYINLVLLAFNLLPALPLDGGRLLRAALWAQTNNFLGATRTAAGIGRAFGMALIGGGLFVFIFAGVFGGAWLAFVGWFLLGAAEAERQAATAHGALRDVRVADVMVREPVTADPDMSLRAFVERVFAPHRHATYPVVGDDRRPLGLMSFRAVAPLPVDEWAVRRVRDHMQPLEATAVVGPDEAASDVLSTLAQSRLNRALVCRGGALVGLLSITDLARLLELRSIEAGQDERFAADLSRRAGAAGGPPAGRRGATA